jgi:hypothetical protein
VSLPAVRLRLGAQVTTLEFDDAGSVNLSVGPSSLAEAVLRHDPPTPAEVEAAIDVVEEALTRSGLRRADRGALITWDARILALPGLHAPGASLRDAVEALFQRLASRSLGAPVAAVELPHGRDLAAALLVLRECMHHLGFERVTAGTGPRDPTFVESIVA